MLRHSTPLLYFQAKKQIRPVLGTMRGRLRHEPKLGHREVLRQLKLRTTFRTQVKHRLTRNYVTANINSAAREHGTDSTKLQRDMSRQNIIIRPRMMQHLAQYEPLAFRSLVELGASGIAPPPPPVDASKEVLKPGEGAANAIAELRADIVRMMQHPGALPDQSPDAWLDSWKEFETAPVDKCVSPNVE